MKRASQSIAENPQEKTSGYGNSNRPDIGTRLRVIGGLNAQANEFEGQIGNVKAYWSNVGVYAQFSGTSDYVIIPYEQCQWNY